MSEKDERKEEQVLDLESAKDMTVGEAVRKQEEIAAGVTPDDSVLDRYIKQHRSAIEAEKFDTKVVDAAAVEAAVEEAADAHSVEELGIHKVETDDSIDKIVEESVPTPEEKAMPAPETADFNDYENFDDEDKPTNKKKWIWGSAVVIAAGAVAAASVWMNQNKPAKTVSSRTSTSQTSTSTSSSVDKNADALAAFDKLYKTYFADKDLTKLKNSSFGKLPDLKAALDKLDKDSDAYKTAKAKYDKLAAAIKATQDVNKQFDKSLIVDGELDTSVKVKADANLKSAKTGLVDVDSLLKSAVKFGQSQQESNQATAVAPAQSAGTAAGSQTPATESTANVAEENSAAATDQTSAAANASSNQPSTASAAVDSAYSGYGIRVPAGVTLQRNLSRVPYDQAKIADSTNTAWNFAPGVLEKIVATAQKRGHISGNQYILERVNIINGNGYYNLFKPDGTYLFSINAKTGYFVGNGKGHADKLDY